MSDPPPTKPKPGSLRDRIAAFENKGPASPPPPAPVPRPKPGGASWKPKSPSPPSSPKPSATTTTSDEIAARRTSGMSATDARESIGMGGSLKERMAALQGRGAFGAPGASGSTSPPPRPSSEKPKWKPPPTIPKSTDESSDHDDDAAARARSRSPPLRSPPLRSPPLRSPSLGAAMAAELQGGNPSTSEDAVPTSEHGDQPQEELDEAEQERQRRAAIAARMARLGGARVGMGPPIFAKKPEIKKPEPEPTTEKAPAPVDESKPELQHTESTEPLKVEEKVANDDKANEAPSDETVQTGEIKEEVEKDAVPAISVPVVEAQELNKEGSSEAKNEPDVPIVAPEPTKPLTTSKASLNIPSSEEPAEATRSPPNSMPVPAIPRRAAPPRRRGKSPAPPQAEPTEAPALPPQVEETIAPTAPPEEETSSVQKEDVKPEALHEDEPAVDDGTAEPLVESSTPKEVPQEEISLPATETEGPSPIPRPPTPPPIPDIDSEKDDVDASRISVSVEQEETSSAHPDLPAHETTLPRASLSDANTSDLTHASLPSVGQEIEDLPTSIKDLEDESTTARSAQSQSDVPSAVAVEPSNLPPPSLLSPQHGPEVETVTERPEPQEEDEEDEAERRQRIAARLAKMGGVNPFAVSHPPTRSPVVSPPAAPERKHSIPIASKPERRDSATSIPADLASADNEQGVVSPHPTVVQEDVVPKDEKDDEVLDVKQPAEEDESQIPPRPVIAHEDVLHDEPEEELANIALPPPLPPTVPVTARPVPAPRHVSPPSQEDDQDVGPPSKPVSRQGTIDEVPAPSIKSVLRQATVDSSHKPESTPASRQTSIDQSPRISLSTEDAVPGPIAPSSIPVTPDVLSPSVSARPAIEQVIGSFRDEPEAEEEGWDDDEPYAPPPKIPSHPPVVVASQSPDSDPRARGNLVEQSNDVDNEEHPPPPPRPISSPPPKRASTDIGISEPPIPAATPQLPLPTEVDEDDDKENSEKPPSLPSGRHSVTAPRQSIDAENEDEGRSSPVPANRHPIENISVPATDEHIPPPLPSGRRPIPPIPVSDAMQETAGEPVEEVAEELAEGPVEKPVEELVKEPTEEPITDSAAGASSPLSPPTRRPIPPPLSQDTEAGQGIPPPLPSGRHVPPTIPERRGSSGSAREPPTAGSTSRPSSLKSPPATQISARLSIKPDYPVEEILDEDEGDPIDPLFHSPHRTSHPPRSPITAAPTASSPPPPPAPAVEEPEDEEQARRRTIAERMAKLGGLKMGFGGPPPPMRKVPKPEEEEQAAAVEEAPASTAPTVPIAPAAPVASTQSQDDETEEDEQARRERIRAKLAQMGGVGMFGAPPPVPKPRPHQEEEHSTTTTNSPPPLPSTRPSRPLARPPSPPTHGPEVVEPEATQIPESQEGTSYEPETAEPLEAEVEVEVEEEEAPPPVPSRADRRAPAGYIQTDRLNPGGEGLAPPRPANQVPLTPTEYVLVEPASATEENAPPPPPRPFRAPPSRAAPIAPPQSPPLPPPPPVGNQWELPSIPSGGLDIATGTGNPSSSWSAHSTAHQPPPPPSKAVPPPPAHVETPIHSLPSASNTPHTPQVPFTPPTPQTAFTPRTPAVVSSEPQPRSSEELMAVWGRIGVQVIESANDLLERSKKSIVGDGSFAGFVDAVLRGVPSARPALHGAPGVPTSYGHIIYTQSGPTVQRRITDIMPGDIIALFDTKFKGHKGLQSYHVHVGEHEPCVGIVSDYEPKKAKVRVFQASQQVAHQTVENVSYRLDDLKSGSIKIFRVLEAQ